MSAAVEMSAEFGLLGPLEARCGGTGVAIAPGKQRAVLAALLLSAGRVVPVDELVEALWGSAPPPSARVTVQNYVMRLRKALGDAGRERIFTRQPGYLISLGAGELDVTRFEGLLGEARTAARKAEWPVAGGRAAAALGLWRGDPLCDIGSDELVLREVPRLAELRLQALEIRIDADLHTGRHAEVIAELQDLVAGHPLREHLHAQRMLALYRDGRQAEALAAYQQARQVLVDELGAEPGAELRDLQQRILAVDPRPEAPAAGPGRAVGPVRGVAGGTGQGRRGSPYQGLRAFGERDTAFFFGREAAAGQLLDRMARCLNGTSGLLVVSGASGAGKSSLLRAGVLPRLRATGLPGEPDAASWPRVVLSLGRAPLDQLAVRAAQLAGADAAGVRRGLDADPAGFALTARQACLPREQPYGPGADADSRPRRLLLLIDQFEHLFTQCPDEAERQRLVGALHAAVTGGGEDAHVPAALAVLVVRADFEARCADYPQLADAVQDRYLVTPMTTRQLRMAITAPAGTAGAAVDDDLVGVLLRELSTSQPPGGRPASGAGVLPLLSHALDQAWRGRTGDTLTLADYERAGGIEGAVAGSAQRAYDALAPAQREVTRQVFTRLTAATGDGTDTAESVPRAELAEGSTAARARDVDAVIEAFAAERLLTLTADSVEISHEVLLNAWPLLRDTWLADTHANRITSARLRAVATEWARHSRDPSYLYHGSLLDAARGTAAAITADPARHPPLSQNERDFLRVSDRARRRTARRRQLVLALLVVLTAGFAVTATAAVHASQVAAGQRDAAVAGQLITQSESLGDADPVLARLESVAAWRVDPSAQAHDAVLNAAALPGTAVLSGHAGEVFSVAFSPDGKTLAVGSGSSSASGAGTVWLWDVADGQQTGVIQAGDGGGVSALAFSPDSKTLAVGTWDGTVSQWTVATHSQIGAPLASGSGTGTSSLIKSLAFSRGGATLAAAGSDGTVRLWDAATGRQARKFQADAGLSMAFSPDGETLAIAGLGTVRLWDVATGRETVAPLTAGGSTLYSVAFSPDGMMLAVGSLGNTGSSGTVRLFDLAGRQTASFAVGGGITSVAFSPDGRTLAAGDYQGTVQLLSAATGSPLGSPLTGASGEIASIAFSPDGRTLAAGSYDGTARLWNVATAVADRTGTPPASPAGTSGKATYAALSPDGKTLAVGASNGTVRLFGTSTGRQLGAPLTVGTTYVTSVAFSRDGRTLATATVPGSVELWDLATRRHVGTVDANAGDYAVSVAFSPDSATLAAAGATVGPAGIAGLFDVPSGRQTGLPLTGGNPYLGAAFSPDGRTLATASANGVVRLWDIASGQQQAGDTLSVPGAAVSLAFSPDGQTLAVGSSNGTAQLFDTATGRQIGSPLALGVPLSTSAVSVGLPLFWLGFSLDGTTLSAVAPDGTIARWDVAYTMHPVAYACASAGRSLTRAEWAQYVQGLPYQDTCP